MISEKEVKHVADLARLGLSKKEIEKMKKELSGILDYVEKLKEVDISEVEFFSSSSGLENVYRQGQTQEKDMAKKLLDLSPEEKAGFLKIKPIFDGKK